MALRIYTDESVPVAVAKGLKQRGVAAWSALDAGNVGLSDQAQLEYARHKKAVIFTHDADFLRLAHKTIGFFDKHTLRSPWRRKPGGLEAAATLPEIGSRRQCGMSFSGWV